MTALPSWARAGRVPRPSLPGLRLVNVVLVAALAGLGVAAYLASRSTTSTTLGAVRTAPVARSVVLSSVSATGALQPASDVGLDFQASGRLVEVAVRPGDHVSAGQVLGRLDSSGDRMALLEAEAGLATARANLRQTLVGETPQQRAVDALSVTQANAGVSSANVAVRNAQAQLRIDERATAGAVEAAGTSPALSQAREQVRTDRGNERGDVARVKDDQAQLVYAGTRYSTAAAAVAAATDALHAAQAKQQSDEQASSALQTQQTADTQKLGNDKTSLAAAQAANNPVYVATWTATVAQDQDQVDSDALALSELQQTLQNDGFAITNAQSAVTTLDGVQTQLNADQASVTSLEAKIATDRNAIATARASLATAVSNAKTSRSTTLAKDRQAIQSAEQQVASARLAVKTAKAGNAVKQAAPTPATLAQLRAAVLTAQANLLTARKTLAQTVLSAPEAGTVAAVDGTVGGQASAGGTTSSSAASAASSSSSSGSGASAGSGSGSSSSSSSFVTLIGSSMQVAADFSESDAAKIAVGQPATVTVSALPTQELAAHVISIGVMGSSSSGVVEYPVVFAIDRSEPALKPGMSANVSVTVAERDGVLNVPSAAVTGSGASARVTVVSNGVQRTVPVVAGLQGDTTTEIVSGLTAGQEVVTSTGATLFSSGSGATGTGTSTTSTTRRFGGGGFGGFGGLGGGIGGG